MAILRSWSGTRHSYSYGHSGLALLLHDIYRPFCHPLRLGFNQKSEKMKRFEQSVAGYDPQVIACQWPSLATIVYSNAVGRA